MLSCIPNTIALYTKKHYNTTAYSPITKIYNQCKMMERPRQRASQHPCDYIFNGARDTGESSHLYAGESSAAEEHLSYEQKRINNKRDELRQHREQHPMEVFAKRKVTAGWWRHANTHIHAHRQPPRKHSITILWNLIIIDKIGLPNVKWVMLEFGPVSGLGKIYYFVHWH